MSGIRCVSICDDSQNPIFCPFCGTKILASTEEEEPSEWKVGNCEHVLFVGTSEGFEYRAKRYDDAVDHALKKISEQDQRDDLENDVLGLSEIVEIPNSFMIEQTYGPPAGFSAFIAFVSLI